MADGTDVVIICLMTGCTAPANGWYAAEGKEHYPSRIEKSRLCKKCRDEINNGSPPDDDSWFFDTKQEAELWLIDRTL